jgi:hypothetical protein
MAFIIQTLDKKKTPWSESVSELYRPSDRRLSAKWLPTFADRGRRSAGDRLVWCCPYVVDHVVAHLSLHSCDTREVRELGEDAVNCCSRTDEFDAGGPRAGGLGRCWQWRDAVQQAVVSAVN